MSREEFAEMLAQLIATGKITLAQAANLQQRFLIGDIIEASVPIPLKMLPGRLTKTEFQNALRAAAVFLTPAEGKRLLTSGDRPRITSTPPEVKKFLRERLRNHFRGDFEATMRQHARMLSEGGNVNGWHASMIREQRAYIARQMTAGLGRALAEPEIDEVNRLSVQQQGFLQRFAGEVSVRRLLGRDFSLAYLTNRSLQYGGVGWGAWFRGNEIAEARGDGYVVRYISVDDGRTCSPCRSAEANGPYLPGKAPTPGEICRGHGLCRCRTEVVFDMDAWRKLKGEAIKPAVLPLRADATEHERELQRIRREKRRLAKLVKETPAAPVLAKDIATFRPEMFKGLDEFMAEAIADESRVTAMQRALRFSDATSVDLEEVRTFVLDKLHDNRLEPSRVKTHGMAEAVEMVGTIIDGREIRWEDTVASERAVVNTLANLYIEDLLGNRLADRLWKANRAIYFTGGVNSRDAELTKEYGRKFVSAATGGDGDIVVYGNRAMSLSTLAHESAHNVATEIYGGTNPGDLVLLNDKKLWTLFKTEWQTVVEEGEEPVSEYAKTDLAEDFAEAFAYYTTRRRVMAENHPDRYALIERILRGGGEEVLRGEKGELMRRTFDFKPDFAPRRVGETPEEARERRRLRRLARKAREAAAAAATTTTVTPPPPPPPPTTPVTTTAALTPEEIKRERRRARRAARKAREAAAKTTGVDVDAAAAEKAKRDVERLAAEEAMRTRLAEEARRDAEEHTKRIEAMRVELERRKAEIEAKRLREEAEKREAERLAAERATAEAARLEAEKKRKLERRKERRAARKAAATGVPDVPKKKLRTIAALDDALLDLETEEGVATSRFHAGEIDLDEWRRLTKDVAAKAAALEAEKVKSAEEDVAIEEAKAEAEAARLAKLKVLRPTDVIRAEIAVVDAEVGRIRAKRLLGEPDTPAEKLFMDTRRKDRLDPLWAELKKSEEEDATLATAKPLPKGTKPKVYRHVLSLESEITTFELEAARIGRKRMRGETLAASELDFLSTKDDRLFALRDELRKSIEEDRTRIAGPAVATKDRKISADVRLSRRPDPKKIRDLAERTRDDLKLRGVEPEQALAALKELIDSHPVTINSMHEILSFWRVGEERFKTQFETGTSRGANNNPLRARAESKGLGYPSDPNVGRSERPVYGYVDIPGNAAAHYGELTWTIKDSVRARMTITVGDSLYPMDAESMIGTPMLDPGLEGIGSAFGQRAIANYTKSRRTASDKRTFMGEVGSYIEWQCQGQLLVSDVESVHDRNGKLTASEIKWLEDRGIKVIR